MMEPLAFARRFALVCAVVGLAAANAPTANAYTLIGYSWQHPNSLTYWSYSASDADSTAWESAAAAWTATPTPVIIRKASTQGAEQLAGKSVIRNDVQWDGISTWWSYNGWLTYDESKLNDYYTDGYSAGKRQSVAAHEFGHGLGLGHSQGPMLMNPATCGAYSRWCTYSIKTPQADDIDGINFLY